MRRIIRNDYIAVKKCKNGTFMYNINDTFIGRSLDLYGEWAEMELRILSQVLSPGNTVLDVGANIGTHTVFFATKVGPTGRVISFEPQRLAYQMLCGNVAINALLNVKCVNAAVGRSSDHIKVPTIDPHQSTNFGALRLAEQSRGEPVSQIRIDDLGLDKCDLIKIDVEGMDLDVLNGAHGVISELKPIIFVENDEVEKSSALIDKLFSLKYQCWWHISPYYNPKNFLNNDTNVFDSYIPSINMLCIHEDFKSQVELPPVKNRNENWRDVVKRLQSSA